MSGEQQSEEPTGSRIRTLIVMAIVAALVVLPLMIAALSDKRPDKKAIVDDRAPLREGDLPFGLASTDTPANWVIDHAASEPDAGAYVLRFVRKAAEPFDRYSVSYFPETGLCEIRAMTPANRSDSFGNDTMASMSRIADALSSRYGKYDKLYDACASGVMCEGRFWDYALRQGNRVHMYAWRTPRSKAHINTILLEAIGLDSGTYIKLTYTLGDERACNAAQIKREAANL